MGRRIRNSDLNGDLELMLKDCLELADINSHSMTAIRIAMALDQYLLERFKASSRLGGQGAEKQIPLS